MKYLPLFHHFKAIYQFPKHIIFLVKIVAINYLQLYIFLLEFFFYFQYVKLCGKVIPKYSSKEITKKLIRSFHFQRFSRNNLNL
jgi:hypothetical protein